MHFVSPFVEKVVYVYMYTLIQTRAISVIANKKFTKPLVHLGSENMLCQKPEACFMEAGMWWKGLGSTHRMMMFE